MAKTVFENGDYIYPDQVNGWQTHVHDGVDNDGHASQVNLESAAHVVGRLPRSHQVPPRGYLDGFLLGYVQATNQWSVTIAPGHCCLSSADIGVATTGSATKYLTNVAGDAAEEWAAGNNVGGVAAGVSLSDGLWLHVFVMRNTSTGLPDFGLDSDIAAANLLSGSWSDYRRVGSVQVQDLGGGLFGIRPFVQCRDTFLWYDGGTIDYTKSTQAATKEDATLSVPTGVQVEALLRCYGYIGATGVTADILVHAAAESDVTPSSSVAPLCTLRLSRSTSEIEATATVAVWTSTARIVRVAISASGTSDTDVSLLTYGWVDPRGRS